MSRSPKSWAGCRWRWSRPPPGWTAPRCPARNTWSCCAAGALISMPAARSATGATRSPRCGRSAWAASPRRTRPRCSCWACAPTWHPNRSRWICSPPTLICCPSRCRRPPPTGWPSVTPSRCWSITPWPSGLRLGFSCTGSCRPPSALPTAAPQIRPQTRQEGLPGWLRREPGLRRIRWRWRCSCCAPMRPTRSRVPRRLGHGGRCCCRMSWPPPATLTMPADSRARR